MTLAARAGVHSAARQAACTAVLALVRELGLEQVRITWTDLHGTSPCKTLVGPAGGVALQTALQAARIEGIDLVSTLLLKDTSDRTAFQVF